MPSKRSAQALRDILESIACIEQFVQGMNYETYRGDLRTRFAVERLVMVVSEAAVRLGADAEAFCPTMPWRAIRGIGNYLKHRYDSIEIDTVWNAISDDLPPLKAAVEKALATEANT